MCRKREKSLKWKKKCLNSVNLTGTFVTNVVMEMMKMCFWYVTFANFIAVTFTVIQVCIMFFLKEIGTVKNANKCFKSALRQLSKIQKLPLKSQKSRLKNHKKRLKKALILNPHPMNNNMWSHQHSKAELQDQ